MMFWVDNITGYFRDVATGKFLVGPLQWWAESSPLIVIGLMFSENLGSITVVLVAPALYSCSYISVVIPEIVNIHDPKLH